MSAELLALLDEWRTTPTTELADEIEALSKRVPVAPLAGKTVIQRDAAFEARAAKPDPLDLPILLAHALARRGSAVVPSRLLPMLERFPRDPRATKPLVEALAHPHWTSATAHGFWDAVFAALTHHADPRARALLEPVTFMGFWNTGYVRLTKKRDKFLAKLPAAERSIPRPPRAKPAAERSIDQLVAAVLAEPARTDLRDVLRDALLQVNDPRGEHMTLDVVARTRPLTVDEIERRNELYDNAWLGPLASCTTHPNIRDGFLVSCGIAETVGISRSLEIGDPAWNTVETIDTNYWNGELPSTLFSAMPSLRALTSCRHDLLGRVWSRDTTWLRTLGIMYLVQRDWRPLLDADDRPPNITRLETDALYDRVADHAWLWTTQLFPGLREITVALGNSSLFDWVEMLRTSPLHGHLDAIELGRFRFTHGMTHVAFDLPPSPRQRPHAGEYAESLRALRRRTLTHVRIGGRALDAKTRQLFENTLANQSLEAFDAHDKT